MAPLAPQGAALGRGDRTAGARCRATTARVRREIALDGGAIAPHGDLGHQPEDALPDRRRVPDPADEPMPTGGRASQRAGLYGPGPGHTPCGYAVDRVFIGSCTNSRIEDLRAAAAVARGRKVAEGVRLGRPGSGLIKRQAEREGLDRIFSEAGFEWRRGRLLDVPGHERRDRRPGERIASTSNRNFVGRQGPGVRTHLMSPAMAAAAAISGRLADVRTVEVPP